LPRNFRPPNLMAMSLGRARMVERAGLFSAAITRKDHEQSAMDEVRVSAPPVRCEQPCPGLQTRQSSNVPEYFVATKFSRWDNALLFADVPLMHWPNRTRPSTAGAYH
jgi:hypothetical protein